MDKKIIDHLRRVLQLQISPNIVAACIIVLNLISRADILYHASFYWDDFIILADHSNQSIWSHSAWSHWWISHDGHTMPLGMWLIYTVNTISPYNWWLPGVILFFGRVIYDILAWRLCLAVLNKSRGSVAHFTNSDPIARGIHYPYTAQQFRYLALLPLIMMIFSPLSFTQQTWWSSAMNTLPLSLALLGALLGAFQVMNLAPNISWKSIKWWIICRYILGIGGSVLAVLCYEKAIIIPWIVLAVVFIDFFYRKAPRPALKIWLPWLVFSVLSAIYGIWAVTRIGQIPGQRSLGQACELLRLTLNAVFPSAIFGGPWDWIKFAPAPPISVDFIPGKYIAYLVMVIFLWLVYRRGIFGLVVCALGYFILSILPVDYIRSGPYTSGLLASGLRYTTEYPIILGLLFALGLCYAQRNSAYKYVSISPAWILWSGVFLSGAVISAHNMKETITIDGSKGYIKSLKWEISQGHEIFDQRLPFYLLTPVAIEEDKISRVFASLSPHIVMMKNHLEVIGDDGHLHRIKEVPVRSISAGCVNPHAISGPLFQVPWMVHLVFPQVKYNTPFSIQLGVQPTIHAIIPSGYRELYITVFGTGKYIKLQGLPCIDHGEILPAILS